jgi:hypothetical protein
MSSECRCTQYYNWLSPHLFASPVARTILSRWNMEVRLEADNYLIVITWP